MLKRFSKSARQQSGASLIELMIAMALGMAALSAVASLVGYGIGVNGKLLANSRLNEEVSSIGALLVRDIKRAGFNGNTVAMVTNPTDSPSLFNGSMVVSQHPDEDANSCFLYSYDQNANGLLDVVGTNENFGFRLRSQTLQIRVNGLTCASDGWENLTDNDVISITGLTFATNQVINNNVISTQISIDIQGELSANDELSRQFTTSFLVRNYD